MKECSRYFPAREVTLMMRLPLPIYGTILNMLVMNRYIQVYNDKNLDTNIDVELEIDIQIYSSTHRFIGTDIWQCVPERCIAAQPPLRP